MAAFSVLDTKPSHILDFPLTVKQQIWFIFFMPSFWITILYIADISTDLAVGIELINESQVFPGALTISLIFISPLIIYFKRLTEFPETKEVNVVFIWFFVETAAVILFPVRLLQCFSERLFWSIEAIRHEDPKREEALVEFENTRAFIIENYIFIQAFFQAGPQAYLQMFFLAIGTSKYQSTEIVQKFCILTSLATLALNASSYQRYETQVRGGRNQVWASNDRSLSTLLYDAEVDIDPQRRRCKVIKIMEEDNPLGTIIAFLFWFLFLFSRLLCLVLACIFIPWVVLGVCTAHYIIFLAYIALTSNCKIAVKLFLPLAYIFCLIEVGLQFKKSFPFYSLFFFLTTIENISLTIFWVKWNGLQYDNCLYLIGISQCLALVFIIIYLKCFRPKCSKIEAN